MTSPPSDPDEATRRIAALTEAQTNVLRCAAEKSQPFTRGRTRGTWAYGTPSYTEKVLQALVRKGLVTATVTNAGADTEQRTYEVNPLAVAHFAAERKAREAAHHQRYLQRQAEQRAATIASRAHHDAVELLIAAHPEEFATLLATSTAKYQENL